jgi:two-component system NtrC family sensor kinase
MHGYLIGQDSFTRPFQALPEVTLKCVEVTGLNDLTSDGLPILAECRSQEELERMAQYSAQIGITIFVSSEDVYYSSLSLGFHTLRIESSWSLHAMTLYERCAEHARNSQRLLLEDEARQSLSVREMLHDLNNAVSIMIGKGQLLRQESLNDSSSQILSQLLEAGRHASAVFKQFSDQRARSDHPQAVTDIVYSTQRTLGLLRYGMDNRIEMEIEIPNGSLLIPLSGAAYTRILLNLLLNAQDAMPDGGKLHLSIANGWHPDNDAIATAVLEVSDTGEGIPIDQQQRIFEPFYTTKGEQGTGLGLSAVQSLLNRCGGRVLLRSNALKGTTFELHFPLVE